MKEFLIILVPILLCTSNISAQFVKGKAYTDLIKEPLINVPIEIAEFNGSSKIYTTDSLGYFFIDSTFLKINKKYRIKSNTQNETAKTIFCTGQNPNDTICINLVFIPNCFHEEHELRVIFDFNSVDLTPESMVVLDQLSLILIDNPKICINIFTTCETNESNKKKLCKGRAKSICNYIVSVGIASGRLHPKYFKNRKPFIIDKTISEIYSIKQGSILDDSFLETVIDENKRNELRHYNRRAEFYVRKKEY